MKMNEINVVFEKYGKEKKYYSDDYVFYSN